MVSFSDLRLSELKENIGTYGKFGIGLTKEWAVREGLNPVFYVSDKSLFTESFLNGVETLFDLVVNDSEKNVESAYNDILNTLRYIKNYKGDLTRTNKKFIRNYVFANERELRFVHRISDQLLAFVPIQDSYDKYFYNNKIKHVRLNFKPDDIKYLIVKSENDINPLILHLKIVKFVFTNQTIDRLSSRILTYEQIVNDI